MLSKSLYIRGLQCQKSLWLKKKKSEVLNQPRADQISLFASGQDVGILAQSLFPNGKTIEFEGSTFDEKIKQTQEWLLNEEKTIYEATFCFDEVLVMVDILQNNQGKLTLYEVKSSTSAKEVYYDDIALQIYVLRGLGYEIEGAYIVHIDNQYVFDKTLEVEKLFKKVSVYDEILMRLREIPRQIQKFKEILKGNEPQTPIGLQCFSPYECDGMEYCWEKQAKIPQYSVFNLAYLKMEEKFKLYHQGVKKIDEIQDDQPFSYKQKIQIQCEKTQQNHINLPQIKEFIKSLRYPIYHLDFETFQQAVPQWRGLSPYQQIPFQYSIHIDYGDGRIEHKEFLAKEGEDPRYALAQSLVNDIPKGVMTMAYNMAFEKGVIAKLAREFEEFKENLLEISEQMRDLMKPFEMKAYYDPKMKGSHSIKNVLPSLIPQMQDAYKNLSLIHHGGEAMEVFPRLHLMPKAMREEYKKALLAYCKLDTFAMVKVLEKLREVAGERND